jgi:hypothetical protein
VKVRTGEEQASGWVAITLRLPQRPSAPIVAIIHEPPSWHPAPRSRLTLDASTAAVVSWELYAAQHLGRRLRSWVRPLHTGEAAGVFGQAVVGLASTGQRFSSTRASRSRGAVSAAGWVSRLPSACRAHPRTVATKSGSTRASQP